MTPTLPNLYARRVSVCVCSGQRSRDLRISQNMQEYTLCVHVAMRMAVSTTVRVSTSFCLGMVMRVGRLLSVSMIVRVVSMRMRVIVIVAGMIMRIRIRVLLDDSRIACWLSSC